MNEKEYYADFFRKHVVHGQINIDFNLPIDQRNALGKHLLRLEELRLVKTVAHANEIDFPIAAILTDSGERFFESIK